MKKVIKSIAILAVCSAVVTPAFAEGVVPGIATGGNSVVNNSKAYIYEVNKATYQNATVKDGRLTLSRVNNVAGADYTGNVSGSIYKEVEFPTTGKITIDMGSQLSNGRYNIVEFYSGETRIARMRFANHMTYTNIRFNEDLSKSKTSLGTEYAAEGKKATGHPFHVAENYVVDKMTIDYDNSRVTWSQTCNGKTASSERYYSESYLDSNGKYNALYKGDDDKFYTDKKCTTLATIETDEGTKEITDAKLGVPLEKTKINGEYAKIDKIVLRGGGNIGYLSNTDKSPKDYNSYDYIKITAEDANGSTVLLNDNFDDSSKIMFDYDWNYDTASGSPSYYFNTDNGFGVCFGGVKSYYTSTKIGFKLGQTFDSGKVVLDLTVKNKTVSSSDGTISVYDPVGNDVSGSETEFLDIYGTDSDGNKVMTAMISSVSSGNLVVGGSVGSGYVNSFGSIFATSKNRYFHKFRFVLDLDNGTIICYHNTSDDSNELVRENKKVMNLTADANGKYTIDEIAFGLRSLQGKDYDIIEYSDINVYAVDENGKVVKPVLFDQNNNEITSAKSGQTVNAYIPLYNEDSSEINCIISNYANDGTFKNCNVTNLSGKTGYNLVKIPFVISGDAEAGDYTRTFVWDNLKNIKPYVDFSQVTVEAADAE